MAGYAPLRLPWIERLDIPKSRNVAAVVQAESSTAVPDGQSGTTSVPTTTASWTSARRISTASRRKARCSPTGTASKAAQPVGLPFITGQSPIRTGLTKVGLPGAKLGLQGEDPTIADLLKPLGYATGQFDRGCYAEAEAAWRRVSSAPAAHGT